MICLCFRHFWLVLLVMLYVPLMIGCDTILGDDSSSKKKSKDDKSSSGGDAVTGGGGQDVGGDDAGNGGPGDGPDEATLGDKTWIEGGDTFLIARLFTTGLESLYPPELLIYAEDANSYLWIDLYADRYNPDYAASYWTDAYPFGNGSTVGYARLTYDTDAGSVECIANEGDVTVSELGEFEGTVAGTINITGGCVDGTVAGSFSIARNSDNSFGNDGSGTDQFVIKRTGGSITPRDDDYQELATTRYDPYIAADIAFPSSDLPTLVILTARVRPDDSYYIGYEENINIQLHGDLAVGSYPVREFTVPDYSRFKETRWESGHNFRFCVGKQGTIKITKIGDEAGEQIEGTYTITSVEEISSLGGCPSEYSGSFVATVESY